jgi:hypothetical protein
MKGHQSVTTFSIAKVETLGLFIDTRKQKCGKQQQYEFANDFTFI